MSPARLFDLARESLGEHPFILLLVGLAMISLGRPRASRVVVTAHRSELHLRERVAHPSSPLVAAGLCVLGMYAAMAIWYLCSDAYYDLAEPTIAAVSWIVRLGGPPHHAPDSATRYAHIYGPVLFLFHASAFRVFGGGLWVSKVSGVVAAFLSLGMLWVALLRVQDRSHATIWVAVAALLLLAFGNISFWTRAEPLLLLCVCAGLMASLQRHAPAAIVGLGIATGVAVNLKLTGPLYLLPLFVVLTGRHGARAAAISGLVAAVAGWCPFALFSNVSATDYWFWLRQSSQNGLRVRLLRPNLEWALYLAAPLTIALLGPRGRLSSSVVTLGAAISVVCIVAAKPGAGPYHLLPFIPLILWFGAAIERELFKSGIRRPWSWSLGMAYLAPALMVASVQQSLLFGTLWTSRRLHVAEDIRTFMSSHPGARTEMGYGGMSQYQGSGPLTYYRPLLVFRGGAYLIDAPAVQEHQLGGIEIPAATLEALTTCEVAFWLIPRDEEPFATRNMYAATGYEPLFSDEFRRTFRTHYRLVSRTAYFDVWGCSNGSDR